MKLRDAMEEALRRNNTDKDLIAFAMSFADTVLPYGAIASLGEIQSGHEEACVTKLAKALIGGSIKAQQQAFEFCKSKVVKPGNN